MVFAQRFVSFLHFNIIHQHIKSLKCFTGYTLGTCRPPKKGQRPHLKTSEIAAGMGARDIFAFETCTDFRVTALKCFTGWSLGTSTASYEFSFFPMRAEACKSTRQNISKVKSRRIYVQIPKKWAFQIRQRFVLLF